MKHVIALLCVIAIAFCQYTKVTTNKFCRRTLEGNFSDGKQTFTGVSDLKCIRGGAQGKAARLTFVMSTRPVPNFRLTALVARSDSVAGFSGRFATDKIVEYVETNNVPGYQVGADQLIKETSLNNNAWTDFERTIIPVGDATVNKLTTQLVVSGTTYTYGAQLTTDEITLNGTVKVVITPNSVKTVFGISNYVYSAQNSRIAIGAILFVRAAIDRKSGTDTPGSEGERPNDNTANQAVANIPGANGNGIFSWQKFVLGRNASSSSVTKSVSLTESAITSANDTVIPRNSDEAGFVLQRIYYSIDERVTEFSWDPSMGTQETTDSNVAAKPTIALALAVVAAVVALLM
jgi:hypothetical protein